MYYICIEEKHGSDVVLWTTAQIENNQSKEKGKNAFIADMINTFFITLLMW